MMITSLLGNGQKLDGGAMFGNVPRGLWASWCPPDEQGRIELACRAMLIEVGQNRILCETGIGAFMSPKFKDRFGLTSSRHELRESLVVQGVSEDSIDYIILSHLHFDHAGGLLSSYENGPLQLLFRNALYVVGREAWERALHPHARDRASYIPELQTLLLASGRLRIIEKNESSLQELPGIRFLFTSGHTPGQMHTVVANAHEQIVFAGDLIPGLAWVHLPVTMGYDRFAEQVIDEKRAWYDSLDLEKTWFFFTHDPACAMAKLSIRDGRMIDIDQTAELLKWSLT